MNAMVQTNTTSNSMALVPRSMDEAMRLAHVMSTANLIPEHLRGKEGDCLLVVMQAQRWGMDAISVAQCTSVVRGKLCYEGKLVSSVLISMGALDGDLDYEFSGNGEHRKVVVTGKLRNGKERTVEGTVGQWQTSNDAWKKDPDQMLSYRGARQWARRWAPSAMLGVYTPDEIDEPVVQEPRITVTEAGRPERQPYPADKFTENLTKWRQVIQEGRKSPAEIIVMAETKGELSEEQKKAINDCVVIDAEVQQ